MSKNDSDCDEDMILFVRRLNQFMRRGRFHNKKNSRPDAKEEIICYNCNKPGHMKFDCPLLKQKSYENDKQQKPLKKKALHAIWDDSDSSSDEEEGKTELANMCFMAHDDEVCDLYDLTLKEL